MKTAIMQPYFLPYLGHFAHIKAVDQWVILDTVQYIRRGWMNRNRIHRSDGHWQYINVPIQSCPRSTCIDKIRIANANWKQTIDKKLKSYKTAPHYNKIRHLLMDSFENDKKLVNINKSLLSNICDYLNINFKPFQASNLPINYDNVHDSDDWCLLISKFLKTDQYINPISGRHIYNHNKYKKHKIQLSFFDPPSFIYNRGKFDQFLNLSVVDTLMWAPYDSIQEYLNYASDYIREQ